MCRLTVRKPIFVIWSAIVLGAGCTSTRTPTDPICAACNKPITGTPVEADGVYYHPFHFTCAYCNEPIQEADYVSIDGKHYHQSCFEDHVTVCAYCGKPTSGDRFVTYEGKKYHKFCFSRYVVKCAFCGKRIMDESFKSSQGKYYHISCYQEFMVPICAFCRNPIRDKTYTTSEGLKYHTSCYEQFVVLRCALCGERIEGDYFTDYWGATYHASHRTDSPSCDFCGRYLKTPLEGGSVKYDDGRYLCGWCYASAVTTIEEVKELAPLVSERLRDIGIDVDVDAISFHIVGGVEMRTLNRQTPHKLTGLTTYQEVVGVPGRTDYQHLKVYVLYGMPRVQTIAALAHELTHVWELLNGRYKINRTLAEGSCDYASYLVLEKIPGGQSEYLMHTLAAGDNRADGDAFRRVKRYAEENGIPRWLALLENNEPLPKYK